MSRSNQTLEQLQEMFKGQVDPDVVDLVLTECQYNANNAVGQLLTLTEGTISTLNGGLHLSCDKLDGIDPIDDPLPITNVLEETDAVGKYSTDQLTEVVNDGNPLQAELKKNPDASLCLVKDSTTSLAETHCSDTLTSRSLVVDSGLSIGTEQLQFQNEAGVCKNDISKAIDICYTETPKLETDFRPDIVGNLEVYMSDNDDSDNENKSRWQLNTFPTHGSSEDANFKPQQSSSFNSHKKSLNQNLERLKRDRKSTLGHPELNQTLGDLCKPEVLLPQSKPHFCSEQLQYFNTFNNGFSPTSVPPQGQFLSAGYQGNETTSQQFVRPPFANQHEQLISRKKPCRNKRSTYGYEANRHRQTEEVSSHHKKLLIILRGLPGSGKSYLARQLKTRSGVIISTDDYFMKGGRYNFNPVYLSAAHEWNQSRAKRFIEGGLTPVIVDNTNAQAWEMKPYVSIGLRCGYKIDIREPETSWKWNVKELERKNIHGINANSLRKMLERYEKSVTIDSIMKSVRQETIVKSPYDKGENFERYPKFKAKEKDECPSSESENENLLQFASDVNSKIRRPIATKKNFLSSNVPETFHTSKCSVDAGKLEGFSKKSPQLITSTLGGKVDVEKIQRDKLESVELELGSAEVNDVVDEHSKCSKPTVSEGNLLRAENTLDKSEDWCSKGGLVSNIQSINSNKCTDEVTRAQDSSEIKMPKLCEDVLDRIIPQSGDLSQGEILDLVNEESNVMLSRNSCLLDKSASTESEATVGGDHSEPQSTSSLSPEKSITGDYSSISAGDTEILVQKNQVTLGTSTVPLISGGYVEVSEDNSENVEDGEVKQSKEIQESGVVSPEDTVMVDNDPSICKIQVENDSSDYSILKAHSQTGDFQPVLKEEIQDIEKMFDSSEEYKVETTDLGKENNDSMDTMKFLEDCFPHVDISLLRSSLDTCRGDLVKTVDYLLKYSDNSDQENISGSDDGFVKESTSETVGTTPQNSSRTPTPTGQVIHSNHAEYLGRKELKDIETMESEIDKEIQDNSSVKSNSTAVHSSANGFQDISFTSLNLTLDPALALQLLEIFGSFSGINPKDTLSESNLSVKIDKQFAQLLYTKWRKTVQEKKTLKTSEEGKLKKNMVTSSPRPSRGNSKRKFKTPPREFYLPEDVHYAPPQHVTSHEPVSLKEIMDEQLAIHVSQSEEEMEKLCEGDSLDLSTKLKRSRLHGMFPGIDAVSLNEIFEANDYNLDKTIRQVQSSCGLPISGNSSLIQQDKSSDLQSYNRNENETADQRLRDIKTINHAEAAEYQSFDEPTYRDFRAEAMTHFKLRDDCIKKAALAYSKKQGELSRIYAEQARAHTEKIKEANLRAAEKISEIRNNDLQSSNTLDLHDLHVGEAIRVLERVLEERKRERKSPNTRSPAFIEVITGRGNRSRKGKPRIKPAVVEYLKRKGYRFEELNMGFYRVFLN